VIVQTLTKKVLIADDHELTRCTLKLLLKRQPFVATVLEAKDGHQAIEQVHKHQPDVVLMDLQMPVMDGWTASHRIRQNFPQIKIIAYSAVENDQVVHLLQSGVIDAFCDKETCSHHLIETIRSLI
jgi:two-component system vancomycin resistance associated response regulator VraR